LRQIVRVELDRRHVDGDTDVARPLRRHAQRLAQHPLADRHDEPGRLGGRDELVRAQEAPVRVLPADQRLEAGNLVALDVEQRLKVESELAVGQRAAQPALEVVTRSMRASIS
jgi:hypothetical protein